ncbi:hypothetical protein HID58_030365, partial [Brassica napus]
MKIYTYANTKKRLLSLSKKCDLLGDCFSSSPPPSVGTTLSGENSSPLPFCSPVSLSHVAMLAKKKKPRPLLALPFKVFRLARPARKRGAMAIKKNKSISLADLGVAASGPSSPVTNSLQIALPATPRSAIPCSSGVSGSALLSKEVPPSTSPSVFPPLLEASYTSPGSGSTPQGSKASEDVISPERNYAAMLKSSAQLQELGTPTEHVSGVPFVLIPDENIDAAKLEFKNFVYARFHGDYPSMGKIIGVVNAVWAKTGPRIFVHNIGQGIYLLRVNNPKTREVLLSRTCWNIGGLPMFVAPWSPEYSPDEPPLTTAIVPVELRNVPYLLFNNESLSRLATAVGKPDSLAPETERKENFEVAKLYVRVNLTAPLPYKIISGFSNGREVQIDVSYPWLPVKCDACRRFGHTTDKCTFGISEGSFGQESARKTVPNGSKPRPVRSKDKMMKKVVLKYVPVVQVAADEDNGLTAEVKLANSEPAGETTTPTSALLGGDEVGLEEGEIGQEVLGEPAGGATSSDHSSASLVNNSTETAIRTSPVTNDDELVLTMSDTADPAMASMASVSVPIQTVAENGSQANLGNTDPLASDTSVPVNKAYVPATDIDGEDTAQTIAGPVTCGVTILSENITLTVTFVYGFNLVEDRRSLWINLQDLHASSPVSEHPWSVLGDFNQMLRSSHHSNHLSARTDESGMEEANLGLQDAQLFEAQAKGLPFTWRNCQDDNPISTRIDHAFINQAWSSSFPDSFADFLDPSQSDHAPCLFRMPAIRRQVIKPFKFFHHVIDHPEYAETVTEAWNFGQITGTDQYKLVRSLKLLKRPLRSLNKRHFSGISQRVKAQRERVDELQRRLLTLPDASTAREEHSERDKLNILLNAEEKYYKQRSRVRWANLGDRNTPFYHRMVSHHASRNHIHFLKDGNENLLYGIEDIKAHAADYFQGILGSTDLPFSAATTEDL